jgi:hypothetical protein
VGLIAIETPHAQEHDVVYVLHESRMPYILRPTKEEFHFLQVCYVHDMMYAEVDAMSSSILKIQ